MDAITCLMIEGRISRIGGCTNSYNIGVNVGSPRREDHFSLACACDYPVSLGMCLPHGVIPHDWYNTSTFKKKSNIFFY